MFWDRKCSLLMISGTGKRALPHSLELNFSVNLVQCFIDTLLAHL